MYKINNLCISRHLCKLILVISVIGLLNMHTAKAEVDNCRAHTVNLILNTVDCRLTKDGGSNADPTWRLYCNNNLSQFVYIAGVPDNTTTLGINPNSTGIICQGNTLILSTILCMNDYSSYKISLNLEGFENDGGDGCSSWERTNFSNKDDDHAKGVREIDLATLPIGWSQRSLIIFGNNGSWYRYNFSINIMPTYSPHAKIKDVVNDTLYVCDNEFATIDPTRNPLTNPFKIEVIDDKDNLPGIRCEWYKETAPNSNTWRVLKQSTTTSGRYLWSNSNSNLNKYINSYLSLDILNTASAPLFTSATSTANLGTDGNYKVRFTNSMGCISTKIFYLKTKITPNINNYINTPQYLCKGQVKTYSLPEEWGEFVWERWDGNQWVCFSNAHEVALNNSGKYKVTVYTKDACEKIKEFELKSSTIPSIKFITDEIEFCPSGSPANLATSINNISNYPNLVWSTGATGVSAPANIEGSYSVIATDIEGCVSTASVNLIYNCPIPYSGEEGWSMLTVLKKDHPINGNEIVNGKELMISDPRYAISSTPYGMEDKREYIGLVRLLYTRNKHTDELITASNPWTYTVNYDLIKVVNGNSVLENKSITIRNTTDIKEYESLEKITGSNDLKIIVISTSSTGTPPEDIVLELELKEQWVAKITTNSDMISNLVHTVTGSKVQFTWTPSEKAKEYELQFAFVDSASHINRTNQEKIFADKGWSMELNEHQYQMDLTFPSGDFYYRIRPIGRHTETDDMGKYSYRKYGKWSAINSFKMDLNAITTQVRPFETDKNWSKVITYAEEGKKKEVISYMDNINRTHQVVTNLNTEKISLVAETYYDHEGRGSLSVLPIPLDNNLLNYQPNLAKVNNVSPSPLGIHNLNKEDFDKGFQPQLNNTTGAAKYYSSQNTFLNSTTYFANKEKIPDANGYVTTQVRYTRDNTGRVEEQSGVGEFFRMDNTEPPTLHTTKNYYLTASETELRRLFGKNVGQAKYYTRQMTVDPNGQISFTYKDQSDKIIATALVGDNPKNLQKLNLPPTQQIPYSLDENNQINSQDGISKLVATIPNVQRNTPHHFKYSLNNVTTSGTEPFSYCANCVYEFSLSVADPNNYPVDLENIKHNNIDLQTQSDVLTYNTTTKKITGIIGGDKTCPLPLNQIVDELIFDATFAKLGPYTITKELKLLSGAVDAFLNEIDNLQSMQEYKDLLHNTYVPDLSKCDFSCEAVTKRYIRDSLKANGTYRDEAQVDEIFEANENNYCPDEYTQMQNNASDIAAQTCGTYYQQLINHISPGGVFFNAENGYQNNTMQYILDHRNENYISAYIPVSMPSSEVTESFVASVWNNDMADNLVKVVDREYCHHQNCIDNQKTNAFDITMNVVKTWSEAITRGYIDGTTNKAGSLLTTSPDSKYALCESKITKYTTLVHSNGTRQDLSLWQMIDPAFIVFDAGNGSELWNTKNYFYSDIVVGTPEMDAAHWRRFISLYSTIKMEALANEEEINGCMYLDDPNDKNIVYPYPGLKPPSDDIMTTAQSNTFNEQACEICNTIPYYYIDKLKEECPDYKEEDKDALYTFFYNNCKNSCGYSNMYGYIPNDEVDVVATNLAAQFGYSCTNLKNILHTGLELQTVLGPDGEPVTVTSCTISSCMKDLVKWLNEHEFENGFYSTNPDLISCFNEQGIKYISINNGKINLLSDTTSCPDPICNTILYFVDPNGNVIKNIQQVGVNEVRTSTTLDVLNDISFENVASSLSPNIICPNIISEENWSGSCTDCRMSLNNNAGNIEFRKKTEFGICPLNAIAMYSLSQPLHLVTDADNILHLSIEGNWTSLSGSGNNSYSNNRSIKFELMQDDVSTPLWSKQFPVGGAGSNNINSINENIPDISVSNPTAIYRLVITISNSSTNLPLTLNYLRVKQTKTDIRIDPGGVQSSTPPTTHQTMNTGNDHYPQFMNYVFPVVLNNNTVQQGWLYAVSLGNEESSCADGLVANCNTQIVKTAVMDEFLEEDPGTDPNFCTQMIINENEALIELLYNEMRNELAASYLNEHFNKCMNIEEHMSYRTEYDEYQYTLYYYDQALNLIQTIPPAAVERLGPDAFDANGRYLFTKEPHHTQTMLTKYQYNTRNQVIWQRTPDGGETNFWYNKKGQLILSQNAKQVLQHKYSFTQYDNLGRIIVVGELDNGSANFTAAEMEAVLKDPLFPYNPTTNFANATAQLTVTTYDKPYSNANGIVQKNLQNRVSATFYFEDFAQWLAHDGNGTLYSYDEIGNVKLLTQNQHNTDKKQVSYNYDLVSGKVNNVTFQPKNLAERYTHRYEYDADNRITDVYTTRDGLIEYHDAKYFYYPHGPLARMELATDKVQGVDYVYTLQGWLKNINKANIETVQAGDDSHTGVDALTPTDAAGTELGYFQGDYNAINASNFTPFGNNKWNSTGATSYYQDATLQGLYNGNIAFQATGLKDLPSNQLSHKLSFTQYQYDQLNRIVNAQGYNMDNGANTATYNTGYTYDANGNIKTLQRTAWNGTAFVPMDNLNYHYETIDINGTPKLRNNKLYHVNDDPILDATFADDIDDEGTYTANTDGTKDATANYDYDAIGQLIKDEKENIQNIEWTVYGKIKSITFNPAANKANLSFEYDATGNRIKKTAVNTSTGISTTTQYWRDAQGNPLYTYTTKMDGSTNMEEKEYNIYGSSRLGTYSNVQTAGVGALAGTYSRYIGQRQYELNNHLGNVMATVPDYKTYNNSTHHYEALLTSAQDYYPFGMQMPGRNYVNPLPTVSNYRFGFNGKENDNEVQGQGNWQDYGMRMYSPRLGRFPNTDPLTKSYPMLSPFQFAANRPIDGIDLDGLEHKSVIHFVEKLNDGTLKIVQSDVSINFDPQDVWVSYDINGTPIENAYTEVFYYDFKNKVLYKEPGAFFEPIQPDKPKPSAAYDYTSASSMEQKQKDDNEYAGYNPIKWAKLTYRDIASAPDNASNVGDIIELGEIMLLQATLPSQIKAINTSRQFVANIDITVNGVNANRVLVGASDKIAVIGRNMSRVRGFAKGIGGKTWDGFDASLSQAENLANNKKWIQGLMDEGYTIYDVGLDPKFTSQGNFAKGAYYEMETQQVFGDK